MKKLQHFSILFFILFLLCAFTSNKDKRYIGKWKGQDKGDIGFLTLTKDRYATFEFGNEIFGGRSYKHGTINASLKYKVNIKTTPYEINFIIWDKKKAIEVGRLRGILKLNNDNEMQMAINFSGSKVRPTNFSSDNITFTRFQ